jgi:hypothetical protein
LAAFRSRPSRLEVFAALVVRLERYYVEFGFDGAVLFKLEEGV